MTTRTLARSGLAALGLLFAFAASGSAADTVYHGSLCNPVQEGVSPGLFTNQWGIANLSDSSSLFVNCGGVIPILATINTVEVEVYDRNPSADVACTLLLVDIFGVALSTSTAFSSGSQVSAQLLRFTPGVATHTINLQCSIPVATASGFSHLTTYRVISTP
jgi:hypothetical protein